MTALRLRVLAVFALGYFVSFLFRGVNLGFAPFLSSEMGLTAANLGTLTSIYFLGFAGAYCLIGPVSVDRSVSAHIVELVYRGPEHRLSEAELFGLYTHADVLGKRFADCLETGILERDGGKLRVTRWGATIALTYMTIGATLGIRRWHLARYFQQHRQKPD